MNILITGATGFIGGMLVKDLKAQGHVVTGLSRDPERATKTQPEVEKFYKWDPVNEMPPEESLYNIDAIIHLAGESIFSPFLTKSKRKRIMESRKLGTRNLFKRIVQMKLTDEPQIKKLRTVVSASAVGYYGNSGSNVVSESSPPGKGFLSNVCIAWEDELFSPQCNDLRRVAIRTAIVLAADGGMLRKISPYFKIGLGAIIGSGEQWMSWIHKKDIIAIYREAVMDSKWEGPVNASSPNPVKNKEFSSHLARVYHKTVRLRIPEFAIKMVPGVLSELLLSGQRVEPSKLMEAGYNFKFSQLKSALHDIFNEVIKEEYDKRKETFARKHWPMF